MNVGFQHAGLALVGLAAAAIPIILHLLLRPKPRPIIFPALQLLRDRRKRTVRRLQVQNWILLALRTLLFAFLGLALARPTVRSDYLALDQKAPVSTVFVFDTSPSMMYKQTGKTRLEDAAEAARGVLRQLPEGSEVTVLDSASPSTGVPLDVGGAAARLDRLTVQSSAPPLNDSLAAAFKGLAKGQKERREIYVFTDLAEHAWNLADGPRLQQLAELVENGVRVYFINVGVETVQNLSLGSAADDRAVQLSQQVLAANGDLSITVPVRNQGPPADRLLELVVDEVPRDSKQVRLPENQTVDIAFNLGNLTEGLHQGRVGVAAADAMPFDDVRYFTIDVRPPVRVLLVSEDPGDAMNFSNALDPEVLRQAEKPRYLLDFVAGKALAEVEFGKYGVVALLNVAAPSPDVWLKLQQYVQGGGGLFLSLGDRVAPAAYAVPQAKTVLPAEPTKIETSADGVFLAPDRFTHPILQPFRQFESTDMTVLPVLKYWKTTIIEPGTVAAPFSNGDPAFLERTFGRGSRGRCLLFATAAHYRPSGDVWTELPLGWSYVVLVDQTVRYLAGVAETNLNFRVGETAVAPLDPGDPFTLFSVTDPLQHVERMTVDPREAALAIPALKEAGHYRVDASEAGRIFSRAFSANISTRESALTPLDPEKLRELVGKDRSSVARDPADLEVVVGEGRVGRDLYPWLILLVTLILCGEGYLSNRFYRPAPSAAV
ncbi:MAG: vWA domain-containing protein [Planctomycetia bacterium]